jgi:hypothetical protein
MSVSERIAVVLQMIVKEGQRDFSLISMYKGVPFSATASISSFDEQRVWFHVQTQGLFYIWPTAKVYLLSDGLLDPIAAQVDEIQPVDNLVRLSGFAFAGMHFAHRRDLRVEPASPLDCLVQTSAGALAGEVVDLSMRGIGVHLANLPKNLTHDLDSHVTVDLTLPEGVVNLAGHVRRIGAQPPVTRLAIEFTGNEPEKSLVVRYLLERRRQIVEEVNQINANFWQGK